MTTTTIIIIINVCSKAGGKVSFVYRTTKKRNKERRNETKSLKQKKMLSMISPVEVSRVRGGSLMCATVERIGGNSSFENKF